MGSEFQDYNHFSEFKILNYADELKILSSGRDILPIMAEIDLTDSCNHNCGFCIYENIRRPGIFMTENDLKIILPQLKEINIRSIVIKGGGEPSISPIFAKALRLCSQFGFHIGLLTNGGNIRNENLTTVSETCDWIRFSLDASCEKVHSKIHKPSNKKVEGFQCIVLNISELVILKKKYKLNITIGINVVVCNDNYNDIQNIIYLAKDLKVDYLSFRTVMVIDNDLSEIIWSEIRQEFNRIKKLQFKNLFISTRFQQKGYFIKRGWDDCRGPSLTLIIQANGDVTTCCDSKGLEEYKYGNIKEHTIQDIWFGVKRQNQRKNLFRKHCYKICTDRYSRQNMAIEYLSSDKKHGTFL